MQLMNLGLDLLLPGRAILLTLSPEDESRFRACFARYGVATTGTLDPASFRCGEGQ